MFGAVEGKTGKGQSGTRWMETIRGIMNRLLRNLKTQTGDQENTTHMVARSWNQLDYDYNNDNNK